MDRILLQRAASRLWRVGVGGSGRGDGGGRVGDVVLLARRIRPQLPATALLAIAAGAVAVGAVAIGSVAVGSVAIGRLRLKEARIGRLVVDELTVGRLHRADTAEETEGEPSP
jgi:hypothetical protein